MEPELNYSSAASITTAAEKSGLPISAIILRQQAEQMERAEEFMYEHMWKSYQVMAECIEPGCNKDLRNANGLADGNAFKMRQIFESGKSLIGSLLSGALYRALAVSELSAVIERVVAAPTAGSCGIPPATLLTVQEEKRVPERNYVMSLLTTPAVGMVIANNASLAGAQGGCQTKCGSAAAMAATAIVELVGGIPKMAKHVITTAIRNILGLVCDLVTGLVEIPCIKRNASGVAGVLMTVKLTLAGIESAIPADEVIWIMKEVGGAMPSILKGTVEGGLVTTPTGRRLYEHVFRTAREAYSGYSGCGGCSS